MVIWVLSSFELLMYIAAITSLLFHMVLWMSGPLLLIESCLNCFRKFEIWILLCEDSKTFNNKTWQG